MADLLQRTREWHLERLGKVTASNLPKVLAQVKSGTAAAREEYLTDLFCERTTGEPTVGYVSAPMLQGTEREPKARAVFEFEQGIEVEEVGFVNHPRIAMSGASPDGLIRAKEILEIKCPTKNTHWKTIKGNKVPVKHKPQIQWQLACTGRDFAWFVSYHPGFTQAAKCFTTVMERDDKYIQMLEEKVEEFLAELNAEVELYYELFGKDAQ